MRIFIISRGYPTPQSPQWGCFEKDQAEALAALGHEVVMLSIDTRFRLAYRKLGITERYINGVHSLDFFYRPSVTYLGYIRRTLSIRLQLLYILKKAIKRFGKPDVLYSHYLFRSVDAVWVGNRKHIPVIGIEHWSKLNSNPMPLNVRWMGEYTYPKLNAIIAVSQPLAQRIQEFFHTKTVHVIHNTYSSDFYYTPNAPDDTFKMVSTGSLLYGKGFDLLIQALHKSSLVKTNWQLSIIGEGEEHTRLQAQIDAAHLQNHIHLLGKRDKPFIADMLRQSSCFILPSRGENFSVAVLEALACGLPIIASITGGIRECIDEKNGLLFEVNDIDGLTRCIEQMAAHYQDYDRQAIADDCQARFSPQVIAQQLTKIFEETIAAYRVK
ncbi:MAG: glycosyltransferase [Paludibacteraceae bacterium]|nr:glycosyltransferase [Paludibacteraceae bacterium]